MKVLLTGASGFIGRNVLKTLQAQGINVVAVGRLQPQLAVPFIEADLMRVKDFDSLVDKAQATHLLHLAWYTEYGKYWTSPLNLRWVEATTKLVEAFCVAGGEQVVAAGTCAEYDWSIGFCQEDVSQIAPSTLYGVTKDVTRRLVSSICESNKVSWAWGRVFIPYGFGEDSRRLIPSLFDVFQKKRAPFGTNGRSYRDFLHVEDVGKAFVQMLISDARGCYNIASGEPTRISDVVRLIAGAYGADPRVVLDLESERPDEPNMLVGDNSKLKELGWLPTRCFSDFVMSQKGDIYGK